MNLSARVRKLEMAKDCKATAFIWHGNQSEAELRAEIAERERGGFRAVLIGWQSSDPKAS